MPQRDLRSTEYLFHLPPAEVDALPFGMITLDREGVVTRYNAAESRLSGLDAKGVVGRNFFAEVAPCTKVRAFGGLYREMVVTGKPAMAQFDFVFRFLSGDKNVRISMAYLDELSSGLILVEEQGGR